MADDFEGTPSLSDEAPGGDEVQSPMLGDDTPGVSDSSDKVGTDDVEKLRSELEDLRKRVSGQTYSWQQERDKRQAYETMLAEWREMGIDPDEVTRAVRASKAAMSQQHNPAQATQQLPAGVVTQEQLNNTLANQRYIQSCESVAEKYFTKNPDDDMPLFRQHVTDAATRIARKELAEHGAVVSTPEQLMKSALKELNEYKNVIAKRVERSMSETREKVKGQGVTNTQHQKQKPSGETDEDRPMTNDEYVAMFRTHQQRFRNKGR